MATSKTATLTLRIDPDLKEALRVAAEHEHRSIANMIEVLIRSHCERHGIDVVRSVGKTNSNGVHS
ncbi:ribbon-helix-helix protein, CopG family [Stenotrophomonas maltophilia]|uniref:ribbon-helix-helix protein, CopG family n=1 Tax=Stenotrophomonas maltophilia TaxID=40324 RepID=UPI0009AFB644|nr:ribbon-helix-helix protein, CopG family [Stenotrophomonas maltophilia]